MPAIEPWIIYALVFGAVLLGMQGLSLLLSRAHQEKSAINRRLALGQRLGSAVEVLEELRRERGLGLGREAPLLPSIELLVIQTGLRLDRGRLLLIGAGLAVALFFLFSFALGLGPLALVLAGIGAPAGLYLLLLLIRRRRIARFGEQFAEAIDIIVRGLRAGHPFRVALNLVSREMPDPIGSEFGLLADEITFGLELNAAIDNLVHRVGHEDLSFFAVAINIQSQTGGNLAEILSRLSTLLRNRIKLRLKVRALTSEGRISAIFLSLAPFILFGIINLLSPDYFGAIRDHPLTLPVALLGLSLLMVGNAIMYRMVNFKV